MYKPTKWQNRIYDEQGNILRDGTVLWAEYLNNMEEGIVKANKLVDGLGKPLGIPQLDERGLILSSQLPTNLKESEVVYSNEEMEAIQNKFPGLNVIVINESEGKWEEYFWTGSKFQWKNSSELTSLTIDWNNIKDKPDEFKPEKHIHSESDIEDLDKYTKEEVDVKVEAKANKLHKHNKEDITDLSVYDKEEIDLKLKDKLDIRHSHKELHTHKNLSILEKLVDLGGHDQVDLDKIYSHKHRYSEIQDKPYIPNKITDLEDDVNLVTSDTKRQVIVSATEPTSPKEGDIWIRI